MKVEKSKLNSPIQCPHEGCGAVYKKNALLKIHIRKHTGERPYICDEVNCEKSFTQLYHLKRHKETAHNRQFEFICTDKDCGRTFNDEYNLNKHIKRFHQSIGTYKCEECSELFRLKSQLRKHLYTHNGVSPFKCDKCDVEMESRTQYLKHIRNHKMYKCDCGEVFYRWSLYLKHKKIACLTLKEHNCKICHVTCATLSNLKQHMQMHEELKATYKCHYLNCNKSYMYKKNLVVHIKSTHEEEAYSCPECQSSFKTKQSVQRHMMAIHKKVDVIDSKGKESKPKKIRKDRGIPKSRMSEVLSGINVAKNDIGEDVENILDDLDSCRTEVTTTMEDVDGSKVLEVIEQEKGESTLLEMNK